MNTKAFSFDLRRLLRDPVLRIFLLVPFIALAAIKLFLTIGEPILLELTGFTLGPYYGYILAVFFELVTQFNPLSKLLLILL